MATVARTSPAFAFRKTTETFIAGAKTLAQRYFISAEVFAEEKRKIFARTWICVGHQSQNADGGDYFVQEVAGESLIILRDKSGETRAFYNVCRHRGTRLCEESSGHGAAIQCPYHAWTYGLDGRLIGAPHMDDVPGFEKSDYPLHPVKVAQWEGFIFVSLADEPAPLEEVFSPLTGKFTHWNLPRLRAVRRIEYDVHANWKLIFQNYSECYHCPGVHPALSKVSPYDSAENDLSEGPFLGGFMTIAKGKSLTMSGEACARPVGEVKGEGDARVFYYSIFPNMLLSLHPDYVMVHLIWPMSPDRTRIVCHWYFHPHAPGVGAPCYNPDDAVAFWDMTNKQDWHVCELSQQGIASRAYQPGPYSPRESIPAAWDREYLRFMGIEGRDSSIVESEDSTSSHAG
ncbi:MAG: aromatic ring-hydroxylating oxygenase subunit alpha [Chthoniobacterales bacterium]